MKAKPHDTISTWKETNTWEAIAIKTCKNSGRNPRSGGLPSRTPANVLLENRIKLFSSLIFMLRR